MLRARWREGQLCGRCAVGRRRTSKEGGGGNAALGRAAATRRSGRAGGSSSPKAQAERHAAGLTRGAIESGGNDTSSAAPLLPRGGWRPAAGLPANRKCCYACFFMRLRCAKAGLRRRGPAAVSLRWRCRRSGGGGRGCCWVAAARQRHSSDAALLFLLPLFSSRGCTQRPAGSRGVFTLVR